MRCEDIRSLNQEARVPTVTLTVLQLQVLTQAAALVLCVITDFRRSVNDILGRLKCYTALFGR